MSRVVPGPARAQRRMAVLASVVAALLLPVAIASGDTGGPPEGSGRWMDSFTQSVCDADSCTSLEFSAKELDAFRTVCVAALTTSLDGQTILDNELGCLDDGALAWRTFAGFITGVPDTSVTLFSESGSSRTVTVSATTSLAGQIVPTTTVEELVDGSCTTTWTIKERRVAVSGTVLLDGVAYATGTDSVSVIRAVKEKTRCA